MKFNFKNCLPNSKGSILAYSLIILGMMLAIATSISITSIVDKKSASSTQFSVQALQTADSGVQLALKKINANLTLKINASTNFGASCNDVGSPAVATVVNQTITDAGGYNLSFYEADATTPVLCGDLANKIGLIKSVGTYNNAVRVVSVSVGFDPCKGGPLVEGLAGAHTITDVRGSETITYPVVGIGAQCWMAENLRATKYPDGNNITKGPVANAVVPPWGTDNALYSCPPNVTNDGPDCAAASSAKLGMLYQWSAAMHGQTIENAQGICPSGWHLPSNADWEKLEVALGMSQTDADLSDTWLRGVSVGVGTKMVAGSFKALFPGNRCNGIYGGVNSWRGSDTDFRSSSKSILGDYGVRSLDPTLTGVGHLFYSKSDGYSVRCVMND